MMKSIRVEFPKQTLKEATPKKRYWLGVLRDCPFQQVDVAGVNFQRFIDPPVIAPNGEDQSRGLRKGLIMRLDEGQVEKILEKLKTKVIRKAGAKHYIRNTDGAMYRPDENDLPLARWLFMIEIGENTPAEAMSYSHTGSEPEPMWSPEPEEAKK